MPEFIKVAHVGDIPDRSALCVEAHGKRIAIYNLNSEYFATDDTCTHALASLSEGFISGDEIVCPLHFATFNIRSGKCTGGPAVADLRTYLVRVLGSDIELFIERSLQ